MRYKWVKNTKILVAAIVFLCFCFVGSPAQKKISPAVNQKIEKLLADTTAALEVGDFARAKLI